MKILQEISSHRQGGWEGQYNRIIRWIYRFQKIERSELFNEEKSQDYFDTLYACFQNIFFLKDWLKNNTTLTSIKLNEFINTNKEIGLCRDICNSTKQPPASSS